MRTAACLAVGIAAIVWTTPAAAQLQAVEVTLFMPCDERIAEAAITALSERPGVSRVDAPVGGLRIRALLTEDFAQDPLSLVQLLWEQKVFPNRIYLEGNGEVVDASAETEWVIEPGGHRFRVIDLEPSAGRTRTGAVRAEVLDWIEDRQLALPERYTVRLIFDPDANLER